MPIHGLNLPPSHLEIFIIPDIKRVTDPTLTTQTDCWINWIRLEPGRKTTPEKMEIIYFFSFY